MVGYSELSMHMVMMFGVSKISFFVTGCFGCVEERCFFLMIFCFGPEKENLIDKSNNLWRQDLLFSFEEP